MSVNGKMTLLPTKPNLMIERPQQEIANATAEIGEAAHAGLVPQLGMVLRALVASPMRNRLPAGSPGTRWPPRSSRPRKA